MISFSFDESRLKTDIKIGSVSNLTKLNVFNSSPEVFTAQTNDENAWILKCSSSGECLGLLKSGNEHEVQLEFITHKEYVENRADEISLIMKDFFLAESFAIDLVQECKSGKDSYLVTNLFSGDVLIISTDQKVGKDSDHEEYRLAKFKGLID